MNFDKLVNVAIVLFVIYVIGVLISFGLTDVAGVQNALIQVPSYAISFFAFYLLLHARPVWLQGVGVFYAFLWPFIVAGIFRYQGFTKEEMLDAVQPMIYGPPTTLLEAFVLSIYFAFFIIFAYAAIGMRLDYKTRLFCVWTTISFIDEFLLYHWNLSFDYPLIYNACGLALSAAIAYGLQKWWQQKSIHG